MHETFLRSFDDFATGFIPVDHQKLASFQRAMGSETCKSFNAMFHPRTLKK